MSVLNSEAMPISSLNASSHERGALVAFENVRRQFPGTGVVIENATFVFEPGQFTAILGPSGCGKSTLLRLAAGLETPDRGFVRVEAFGREHFRGYVFQESRLLPWRNTLDNAALPLELIGWTKQNARLEAQELLERVGLGDSLTKFPNELSGGMRMRASLARALVAKPSLLLLDEPFAALDEKSRHALQDDLRKLWESMRMTVLFVTHSVSEAVSLAERAITLSSRPARVVSDRRIDLPAPRPADFRLTDSFLQAARDLTLSELAMREDR